MDAAAGKLRRLRGAVGRGHNAVGVAVQRDGGHGDDRQRRQPALDVGILRIAVGEAEAMTVAVDHDIDIVGIVVRHRRPLEARIVEMPVRRPLLPQDPGDVAPVGGKTGAAALELKIILVPERDLALRLHRNHRLGDILDQIAVDRDQADAALRPQRRADAGGASAPVIAGEHGALDGKRIHQRDQVGADRGLLARTRRRRIAETGRTVAAQIGHDDAAALGGEQRGDVDIGVDVVGKAVQQHHDRAVRGPAS